MPTFPYVGVPGLRVELGLAANVAAPTIFTLDDPLRGLLDQTPHDDIFDGNGDMETVSPFPNTIGGGTGSLTTDEAHGGSRSLAVSTRPSGIGGGSGVWCETEAFVSEGWYQLDLAYRTVGTFDVNVYILFSDQHDAAIDFELFTFDIDALAGWVEATRRFQAPLNTATAQVHLWAYETDQTFYVDDLGIGQVWPLGEDNVWVDIDTDLRVESPSAQAATIDRSRADIHDEQTPASGTLSFVDVDRVFDPDNPDSPHYGRLGPGIGIRMFATYPTQQDQLVFTGVTRDFIPEYAADGLYTRIRIPFTDGLGRIAGTDLDEITEAHAGDRTGERVARVLDLDEVQWPAAQRNLELGQTACGATTFGENALAYLQRVTKTEHGWLFVDRTGTIRFRDRLTAFNQPLAEFAADEPVTFTTRMETPATWYELPSGGMTRRTPAAMVRNRVTVSGVTGVEKTSVDEASIRRHGPQALSRTNLLMESDADAQGLADWLVLLGGDPPRQFQTVTVNLVALHVYQQQRVLQLDIGDRVRCRLYPPGSDDPIEQAVTIIGMKHTIAATSWQVTFDLRFYDSVSAFILDDPEFGTLDGEGRLIY
ncbi:MAG: hypothetical protein S0880_13085 [Actinomycetota bacterium]|nr:hypothetical protein [Actinomycetota bacterium]